MLLILKWSSVRFRTEWWVPWQSNVLGTLGAQKSVFWKDLKVFWQVYFHLPYSRCFSAFPSHSVILINSLVLNLPLELFPWGSTLCYWSEILSWKHNLFSLTDPLELGGLASPNPGHTQISPLFQWCSSQPLVRIVSPTAERKQECGEKKWSEGRGGEKWGKIILSSSCHTFLMIIKEPNRFSWLCPLMEGRWGEGKWHLLNACYVSTLGGW